MTEAAGPRSYPCQHPGCDKPGIFGENDFIQPRGTGPLYWCGEHRPAAPVAAEVAQPPEGPPRAQERLL